MGRVALEALDARRLLSGGAISVDPAIALAGPTSSLLGLRPAIRFDGPAVMQSDPQPAPTPTTTIEGVNFEQEGALNAGPGSFGTIPPDPAVAAGPAHVVHAVSAAITFHTKAGAQTFQSSLFNFFQGLPLTDLGNPRVAYDHFSARWIVTALDRTDISEGAPSNSSRLFIAASDDADPNGTWTVRSINTNITIGGQASWADFSTLAVDDEAIYVSSTQFRFGTFAYAGNRLQIIDKAQLYDTGILSFTTHDVFAATGQANVAGVFALQPAMMYGAQPSGLGTFFVNSAGWQDVNGDDFVLVVRLTNPLTAPAFTSAFVSQGGNVDDPNALLPGAPQSGTGVTIRTGDRRITSNAVWNNGNLYFAHNSLPLSGANAGQTTAKWYRVNAGATGTPTLADTGLVGGEELGAATHTFLPSVAVDNSGVLAVGFAASNSGIFPSAGYTIRLASDAPGTTQPATAYAAGEAFYVRTYFSPANQSNLNRWGDYNSIALDPADGSFWAFNQYARTQGMPFLTEEGRWGTRLANFSSGVSIPPPPSAPDLAAASDSGASNTDNITNISTPTFSGTALANSSVQLFAGALFIGTTTASAGGAWTIVASSIPDGTYNVTATATNANGTSPNSPALVVTIDTTPPRVSTAAFAFATGHSASFTFNEPLAVSPTLANVAVTNTTTAQPVPGGALSLNYNAGANTAALTFPGVAGPPAGILADGNYTAVIAASGVADVAGNMLDGNSNGVGGDNFLFNFFVLAGDANRSRSVSLDDFTILAANFGFSPRNFAQGDFSYDGMVNLNDFTILAANFGQSLPVARPTGAPVAASVSPFAAIRIEDRPDARIAADVLPPGV